MQYINNQNNEDTIMAIATPPGRGGIGIIRISGKLAINVAHTFFKKIPDNRKAELLKFRDKYDNILDQVIVLFFPAPNSFTGENVLEIQGHGGNVILDLLIQNILQSIPQIRIANPGEFSKRAFLNNKIDLTQAEAIADLINADSYQAAKSASNSLQGEFSNYINRIMDKIIQLRVYIESEINFPEENLETLSNKEIEQKLNSIINDIKKIYNKAHQGTILQEGIKIVISGKPNTGKSSLFNLLAQSEKSIITNIPGTTRDVINEHIFLDGLPLHIADTAGIRKTNDTIELIGIKKTWNEIKNADHILYMTNADDTSLKIVHKIWINLNKFIKKSKYQNKKITIIRNKIDLSGEHEMFLQKQEYTIINLSTKYNFGINILKKHLKNSAQFNNNDNYESNFIARRRHLELLNNALQHLKQSYKYLKFHTKLELLAEELHLANKKLTEITGKLENKNFENLLDKIFSKFCIGK